MENDTAAKLRARVANVLKTTRLPPSNITKEERKDLADLKKCQNILMLPSDKRRCTVVVDKISYEAKVNTLLSDTSTYTKLKKDPTRKYQSDLAAVLKKKDFKTLKEEKVTDDNLYYILYPTACAIPGFYVFLKIHKENWALRPIVSSIGSVSYEVARFITDILSLLVGKSPTISRTNKAVLEPRVSPAFVITYLCNHCNIRFDPIPVKVRKRSLTPE